MLPLPAVQCRSPIASHFFSCMQVKLKCLWLSFSSWPKIGLHGAMPWDRCPVRAFGLMWLDDVMQLLPRANMMTTNIFTLLHHNGSKDL